MPEFVCELAHLVAVVGREFQSVVHMDVSKENGSIPAAVTPQRMSHHRIGGCVNNESKEKNMGKSQRAKNQRKQQQQSQGQERRRPTAPQQAGGLNFVDPSTMNTYMHVPAPEQVSQVDQEPEFSGAGAGDAFDVKAGRWVTIPEREKLYTADEILQLRATYDGPRMPEADMPDWMWLATVAANLVRISRMNYERSMAVVATHQEMNLYIRSEGYAAFAVADNLAAQLEMPPMYWPRPVGAPLDQVADYFQDA